MGKGFTKEEALELLPNAITNLEVALDERKKEDVRKFRKYLNTLLKKIGGVGRTPGNDQKAIVELLEEASKY